MSKKKSTVDIFLEAITKVEKKRLTEEIKNDIFNYLNKYIETLSLFKETMKDLEAIMRKESEEKEKIADE